MRSLYQTINRKTRAQQHRQDAEECDRAGYPEIARINWEMAMMLDPPRSDEEDDQGDRRETRNY